MTEQLIIRGDTVRLKTERRHIKVTRVYGRRVASCFDEGGLVFDGYYITSGMTVSEKSVSTAIRVKKGESEQLTTDTAQENGEYVMFNDNNVVQANRWVLDEGSWYYYSDAEKRWKRVARRAYPLKVLYASPTPLGFKPFDLLEGKPYRPFVTWHGFHFPSAHYKPMKEKSCRLLQVCAAYEQWVKDGCPRPPTPAPFK